MSGFNVMRKIIYASWFGFLVLTVVSTYGWTYVDEWPIVGGGFYTKVGSWISVTSISVLEGERQNTAKLNRFQTNQEPAAVVKPKPRPRLGGTVKVEDHEESRKTHEDRVSEASRFLAYVEREFTERWNAPRDASEAMQWAHEIEAECVFVVNKQNGMISIESTANDPGSTEMVQIRQRIDQNFGGISNEGKPFATPSVTLERFRNFVLSLAPLKIPDVLNSLPGNTLRIRFSVKVVKTSNMAAPPPEPVAAPAPDANTNQVTAVTAANVEFSGASSTYTHNPGEFTRPISKEELRKHTDVADPVYQYVIGFRYLEGDGLQMDYVLALHWFTKAAEQGYAPAQSQLGFMYSMNYGAPRDTQKALYWYRKAAEQNYIQAIFNISTLYSNGDGMARDMAEAAKWLRKGAELGDSGCQAQLAWLYICGEGMVKEPQEAFHWYMKAALQGHEFAQFSVGKMYENGEGVPKDEVEALAWYNLSPTNGVDERTNRRAPLERALGPEAAKEARRRAEKFRERIANRAHQ